MRAALPAEVADEVEGDVVALQMCPGPWCEGGSVSVKHVEMQWHQDVEMRARDVSIRGAHGKVWGRGGVMWHIRAQHRGGGCGGSGSAFRVAKLSVALTGGGHQVGGPTLLEGRRPP